MDGRPPRVRLSDLQLDVMRVLWRSDASVAEVVDALQATRALAHTTVATVLTRLARAGIVARVRGGRLLRYRACVSEASVRQAMVDELLDSVFQGDADALRSLVGDGQRETRDVTAASRADTSGETQPHRRRRSAR